MKQLSTEFVWEFNHRFKTLMAKVSFQMSDVQHKEWFIAAVLLHIWIPLMQQNIVSHTEALELAMKLESSPLGETCAWMMQIQLQIANLMLQLQDINKGKHVQEEMWCTICRTEGHHKDNRLEYMNYVTSRASNLINT